MDKNKKVMIIVPGIPHEHSGASTVLFYYYIKSVKNAEFNTRNILLIQPDNMNEEHLATYLTKMNSPNKFEVIPLIFNKQIIEETHFNCKLNPIICAKVICHLDNFRPDVILCFDLLGAWLASKVGYATKIAWLGDLNFQTQWYHALYFVKERYYPYYKILPFIIITWLKCKKWKKIYIDVLSQMVSIIVSSKSSEIKLSQLGLHSTYLPYPWPNFVNHNDLETTNLRLKPTFLFYGTLKALGSRSSFHYMIYKLYPKLLQLWGSKGFRIIIAGRGGLYTWIEKEFVRRPEFEYIGFAEDLTELMKTCHAVIVPIDIPVGNRSRIITAMANDILIIAHKNTALANPDLIDGKTCLLAKNVSEFVSKMKQAVRCLDKNNYIINNAKQVYLNKFYPKSASKLFIDHLMKII
jgi:glycosyltransferase involved in cell wall biosynthesis